MNRPAKKIFTAEVLLEELRVSIEKRSADEDIVPFLAGMTMLSQCNASEMTGYPKILWSFVEEMFLMCEDCDPYYDPREDLGWLVSRTEDFMLPEIIRTEDMIAADCYRDSGYEHFQAPDDIRWLASLARLMREKSSESSPVSHLVKNLLAAELRRVKQMHIHRDGRQPSEEERGTLPTLCNYWRIYLVPPEEGVDVSDAHARALLQRNGVTFISATADQP